MDKKPELSFEKTLDKIKAVRAKLTLAFNINPIKREEIQEKVDDLDRIEKLLMKGNTNK